VISSDIEKQRGALGASPKDERGVQLGLTSFRGGEGGWDSHVRCVGAVNQSTFDY